MRSKLLSGMILCALFSFSSFAQDKKDERFNFPDDFGKTESTVLVSPGSKNNITKCIIEAFEDNYTGSFLAVEEQYPKVSNYDYNKYRYIFIIKEHQNPGYWVGRERFPPTTDYKFGLLDRKTGKSYDQDFWSGNYKKGAKNYVKNLEELRKKNAGN